MLVISYQPALGLIRQLSTCEDATFSRLPYGKDLKIRHVHWMYLDWSTPLRITSKYSLTFVYLPLEHLRLL